MHCLLTKQPITFIITWKMTLVENVEEEMRYLGFHCFVLTLINLIIIALDLCAHTSPLS